MFEYNKSILTVTEKDNISYLQFNRLLEFQDKLIHGFTLKRDNFGFHRNHEDIRQHSLDLVSEEFGVSRDKLIQPTQKHTNNIYCFNKFKGPDLPSNDSFSKNDLLVSYIDDNDSSKDVFSDDDFLEIDGFISNVKDIATLTTAADCTSILMYDPDKNVYANIHSGWRGTVLRIVEKALSIMRFEYGCDTRNIICCIGPSIRKECFLVNEDVVEIFIDEFSNYTKRYPIIQKTDLTNEKGVQYKLDSNRIIKLMMQDAGVIEENIIDSNICTNCNSEYFHSKRKEGADDFNINGCLMSLK